MTIRSRLANWIVKSVTEDVSAGALSSVGVMGAFGRRPKFSPEQAVKQYKSWVFVAANKNAAFLASTPLRLYATRSTGESAPKVAEYRPLTEEKKGWLKANAVAQQSSRVRGAAEIVEITDHPFLDLMQNANRWRDGFETFEETSIFEDCTGNCFWRLGLGVGPMAGIPTDLWIMPSQHVAVVPDKKTFVKGYLYGRLGKRIALTPEQVVHFRRPNIRDMWYGMSRTEGAYAAIHGYESMEDYEARFTDNRGVPPLLMKYKTALRAGQRRTLEMEWNRVLAGNSTAMIGDEDVSIEKLVFPPRELGFLKGREWRFQEIITAFGQTVAMYDKTANRANVEGAIYIWAKAELDPTNRRHEQKLNAQLIPMYDGGERLFCAFDPIAKEDKDFLLKRDVADAANSIRTRNEIRAARGLPPNSDPRADELFVQSAPTLAGGGGSIGLALTADTGEVQIKRTTPAASSPPVAPVSFKDVDISGAENAALTPREAKLRKAVQGVFNAQLALAVDPAFVNTMQFDWVASQTWADEIYKATHGLIGEMVEVEGVKAGQQVGVAMTDFVERPNVQRAIYDHTYKFAQATNNKTVGMLQSTLANGEQAGETITQLTKRVQEVFQGTDRAKGYRAERIARTESRRAQTTGTVEAWKETGVVSAKVWDAAGDACVYCRAMNGKVVDLGQPYFKQGDRHSVEFEGKEYVLKLDYLDVDGPPLHPGCRCVLRPELVEVSE